MHETMNQVELALPTPEPEHDDASGFAIGWDHAHHGLVPPPELLLEGTPIGQGWRAGRAVFNGRSRPWPANRHTRQWLALRIEAWRAGAAFDLTTVTPNLLAQIEVRRCPVRRVALGGRCGGPAQADAACIERLNPQAAYAAGNLVVLSLAAARAWHGLGVSELVQRARAAEAAAARLSGVSAAAAGEACQASPADEAALDAAAFWRLATLRALATPLHAAEAARLPLAVLPPNRVRVLNAALALQVLLTLQLASPDWCARVAVVAALLPAHSHRTDFNLWVGALAPRLLQAHSDGRDTVQALEDAWLGERVQRRWHQLVLNLGEAACEQLVRRLASEKAPGRHAQWLRWEQALDGWSLPAPAATQGHADRVNEPASPPPGAATQPPARPAGRRRTAQRSLLRPPRATVGPRNAAT